MKPILWFVSVLLAATALDVSALHAQTFQGTGQEATDLFRMEAGLVVFEVEHRGTGDFAVRLLDEQGRMVEELARASGEFRGSKAVRVPQGGRYLLDVSASGPWSVRRRDSNAASGTTDGAAAAAPASPVFLQGQEAGAAAASEVSTGGWLARGFLGGVVAGPIGAAVAVSLAGRAALPVPGAMDNGGGGEDYRLGYQEGFAAQVREARRKRAFIGGMLGSGVLIAGAIMFIDIAAGGEGGAVPPDPGTGGEIVLIPR